jgi:hypothetical protein
MMIDQAKAFWQMQPRPTRFVLIGSVVVIVMLIVGGVGGIVSAYKDRAFARKVEALKAERQKDIECANAAEERAKSAEAEKAKFQIAFELAGKDAEKAMKKVEDAQTKFNQETERINSDMDDCARYNELRTKLKLKPADCQTDNR